MDGVIIDTAARMSQYLSKSCLNIEVVVKIDLTGTENGSVTQWHNLNHIHTPAPPSSFISNPPTLNQQCFINVGNESFSGSCRFPR